MPHAPDAHADTIDITIARTLGDAALTEQVSRVVLRQYGHARRAADDLTA
jgi:hypothetical protein